MPLANKREARPTFLALKKPLSSFKVPEVGLEPTSLAAHDFESCVYAIPPLGQAFVYEYYHH